MGKVHLRDVNDGRPDAPVGGGYQRWVGGHWGDGEGGDGSGGGNGGVRGGSRHSLFLDFVALTRTAIVEPHLRNLNGFITKPNGNIFNFL